MDNAKIVTDVLSVNDMLAELPIKINQVTLRDIHDETNCPIVLIGMGLAHKKIERYKHLYDRFSEIVKFETFAINDLKQIFDQLSEVKVATEAIEYIHKKYNRFRQIVQLINQLEIVAKENNFDEITKEIVEQII